MKYIYALLPIILVGCDNSGVQRVVHDPKIQSDAETIAEDALDIFEEIVEDETGVKVNINLPKAVP
ncbi:MAG TPA: hypothetical protein VNW29_04380 [Candidatus Sulfotelmatobacter sp.]|jgi:hypothetical protein|nr:hypothetical protein [Candidatus Sulfotelmatobacter sp.]